MEILTSYTWSILGCIQTLLATGTGLRVQSWCEFLNCRFVHKLTHFNTSRGNSQLTFEVSICNSNWTRNLISLRLIRRNFIIFSNLYTSYHLLPVLSQNHPLHAIKLYKYWSLKQYRCRRQAWQSVAQSLFLQYSPLQHKSTGWLWKT